MCFIDCGVVVMAEEEAEREVTHVHAKTFSTALNPWGKDLSFVLPLSQHHNETEII